MKLGLVFGVVLFTGCATQELTTTQEDRFDPATYKKVRADRHGSENNEKTVKDAPAPAKEKCNKKDKKEDKKEGEE